MTELDLHSINERFNADLDRFNAGTLKSNEVLHLGTPSDILRTAGINETEIILSQSVLRKKIRQHGLEIKELKGLADAIQTPIMVYEWGAKAKSIVIITDLTRISMEKITVAIAVERHGKRLEINDIVSIHGKSKEWTLEDFSKAIGENPLQRLEDKLKYVDKEKTLGWLAMAPPKGASQANQESNQITKILKNFQNPKFF